MHHDQNTILQAYETRSTLNTSNVSFELKKCIEGVIQQLDQGEIRVAEKTAQGWIAHEWIKKAILLYFLTQENALIEHTPLHYFDKIPLKFSDYDHKQFQNSGTRIVPPACVRKGAYLAPKTIIMPSYINLGAYVDSGTLIDTWATVGSCAQIGKNVHLSGGAGIGGVLEPVQANPTIIEDNVFIGARSEIVEGVIIEENSVVSMGVFIGQSTPIYNRMTGETSYGRVPAGSVVVAGSRPAADGTHSLNCAVIVKQVDAKTREKVSLNELLRVN